MTESKKTCSGGTPSRKPTGIPPLSSTTATGAEKVCSLLTGGNVSFCVGGGDGEISGYVDDGQVVWLKVGRGQQRGVRYSGVDLLHGGSGRRMRSGRERRGDCANACVAGRGFESGHAEAGGGGGAGCVTCGGGECCCSQWKGRGKQQHEGVVCNDVYLSLLDVGEEDGVRGVAGISAGGADRVPTVSLG
ncbi:PI-PLC X domain containing protein [Gracilaria domingensis]|nr:PI-PLC X domain containing protein [Gracilaria domingensis]